MFQCVSGAKKYGIKADPEEEALEMINQVYCSHKIAWQIGYCVGGNFNIHIWA